MSHRRPRLQIGPYSVGEIPRALSIAFVDPDDGAAVDLSGFQADFVIEQVSGEAASGLGAGVAAIADAAGGIAEYAWAEADFAAAGRYRGQMWVGDGTNRLASIEFWWDVVEVTAAPEI